MLLIILTIMTKLSIQTMLAFDFVDQVDYSKLVSCIVYVDDIDQLHNFEHFDHFDQCNNFGHFDRFDQFRDNNVINNKKERQSLH